MTAPLVKDPGDLKQVEAAEKLEKRREKIRGEVWREVLEMPVGRQVIQEILQRCGTLRQPYDPDNSHNTDFKCGQMNIGLWLLEQIDLFHEDALWQMKREEKKRMEA